MKNPGKGSRVEGRGITGGFTLIELLAVIAIIGLLVALVAPMISRGNVTVAAQRQLLDDFARARQLAISRRSTVYMVFIPTNFWGQPVNIGPWSVLNSYGFTASTVVTQMYAAQWNGYYIESLRSAGDQPGHGNPEDLARVRTLPAGSFIAPLKFSTPVYPYANAPHPANRPDLPIYGFPVTNNIPFPTADVLANPTYGYTFAASGGLSLPYIAFNYLGQLTPGDGSVLPYDENIPLAYGTIAPALNPISRAPVQGPPNAAEIPANNSMSISYNVIHIDHLTGRARLERQEVQ
jgi:prepilin-type N-terminal cleavage/methylation domain-containing protein